MKKEKSLDLLTFYSFCAGGVALLFMLFLVMSTIGEVSNRKFSDRRVYSPSHPSVRPNQTSEDVQSSVSIIEPDTPRSVEEGVTILKK